MRDKHHVRPPRRLRSSARGRDLKQARLSKRLLQAQVAPWYGTRGVSVARISQIEASETMTTAVHRKYQAAIRLAIAAREKVRRLLAGR